MKAIPKNILEYPIFKNIIDKEIPISHSTFLIGWLLKADQLRERKNPKDMVTLLNLLVENNSVIVIPKYESSVAGIKKENEIVISNENRHGKIVGLIANKKNFSFSIRIIDSNIINKDNNNIGEFRLFKIVDPEGNKYKGLDQFQVISKVEGIDKLEFDSFVSQDRQYDLFSENYFLSKLLMKRLSMESSYYNSIIKEMLNKDVKYPLDTKKSSSGEYYPSKGIKKIIKAFTADVYVPDLDNDSRFPEYEYNQENLIDLTNKRKDIIYKIIPKINFMCRAIEFAYFKYNKENKIPDSFKEIWGDISQDQIKIGRTMWDSLKLSNGLEIRKREYEITENMTE